MKQLIMLILASALSLVSPVATYAKVGSTDLIEHGKQYERSTVVYEGEVIGEDMLRGDFGWLNVNDGNNTMGVWVDRKAILPIKHYGGYKYKGDLIRVTGVFHRSCPEHGGDLDIHARTLAILQSGRPTNHPVQAEKYWLAFLLLSLAVITHFWQSRRQVKIHS